MKNVPQCPRFIMDRDHITQRQWRHKKRRELMAAIKAMDILRMGCAYTPSANGVGVRDLYDCLKELREAWSQKEWGK